MIHRNVTAVPADAAQALGSETVSAPPALRSVYGVPFSQWPAHVSALSDEALSELFAELDEHNETPEEIQAAAPWLAVLIDERNIRNRWHAEHSSGGFCVFCFQGWPCVTARAARRPETLADVLTAAGVLR